MNEHYEYLESVSYKVKDLTKLCLIEDYFRKKEYKVHFEKFQKIFEHLRLDFQQLEYQMKHSYKGSFPYDLSDIFENDSMIPDKYKDYKSN